LNIFRKSIIKLTGSLHEGHYTFFFLMCLSFLLRMRNVSDKICRGNQNTNFMFSNFFFFLENLLVYKILWKKYCIAEQSTDDSMAHARCLLDNYGCRSTLRICNTSTFFSRQQWLYEHCFSCLVLQTSSLLMEYDIFSPDIWNKFIQFIIRLFTVDWYLKKTRLKCLIFDNSLRLYFISFFLLYKLHINADAVP
jgi:hypothetical protein